MNISLNPHFEDAPKCQGTLARTLTYAAQPVFGLPQDTDAGCYRIVGAKCHRIRVGLTALSSTQHFRTNLLGCEKHATQPTLLRSKRLTDEMIAIAKW